MSKLYVPFCGLPVTDVIVAGPDQPVVVLASFSILAAFGCVYKFCAFKIEALTIHTKRVKTMSFIQAILESHEYSPE
jgi:hypothetical protein